MVQPLGIYTVNWKAFIDECTEHLGYSPTRGIDAIGLQPKEPQAFLACLNLENNAPASIQDPKAQRHIFLSFIGLMDIDTLNEANSGTDLAILSKESVERSKYLTILSGTLKTWKHSIIDMCSQTTRKQTRIFFFNCLGCLENAGFSAVWSGYSKFHLADGTTCLMK